MDKELRYWITSRREFLAGGTTFGLTMFAGSSAFTGLATSSASHAATTGHTRTKDVLQFSPGDSTLVEGWLGDKINRCIHARVMSQSIEPLVQPFAQQSDKDDGWRGEFWGKWFTSAVLAYRYERTPQHRAVLDNAVAALLKTRDANGRIDTYDAGHRGGAWDVWTRKYVLLGLLDYYDVAHDEQSLQAARGVGDSLLADFGAGRASLPEAGLAVLGGLSSSSVLQPVCLLYERTGERRYLDFAEYIVAQWETPNRNAPHSMHLVEDALAGKAPTEMVAPKAYEMMSCFEGVCELYRITGRPQYKEAVVRFGETLRHSERMINGGASNQELWCNGAVTQTATLEQPQETCVTTTWMRYCAQLLRLTGDPVWADEIELSLYNALASAQTPDGSWWAYFSPLVGQRVPSLAQFHEVGLSCCVANGPRGLLLAPFLAVMQAEHGPVVNLYLPGHTEITLSSGNTVRIEQSTTYPLEDRIRILVRPASPAAFTMSLRIPAWSTETQLTVDGQPLQVTPGRYATITRHWPAESVVELKLDLRGRAVQAPANKDSLAVMRGPVLLAMDSRLVPQQEVAAWLVTDKEGFVELTSASKSADVWMSYDVAFEVRPSHFFNHHKISLTMCDYASAGNQWSAENLYRTWLPQPTYLADLYPAQTWKIMYPDEKARPQIPKQKL